jgi:hypothetical protein
MHLRAVLSSISSSSSSNNTAIGVKGGGGGIGVILSIEGFESGVFDIFDFL